MQQTDVHACLSAGSQKCYHMCLASQHRVFKCRLSLALRRAGSGRPVVRRHCEVAAGVGCGVDPRSTGSAALEVLCNLSYVGGSADTPSVFF